MDIVDLHKVDLLYFDIRYLFLENKQQLRTNSQLNIIVPA